MRNSLFCSAFQSQSLITHINTCPLKSERAPKCNKEWHRACCTERAQKSNKEWHRAYCTERAQKSNKEWHRAYCKERAPKSSKEWHTAYCTERAQNPIRMTQILLYRKSPKSNEEWHRAYCTERAQKSNKEWHRAYCTERAPKSNKNDTEPTVYCVHCIVHCVDGEVNTRVYFTDVRLQSTAVDWQYQSFHVSVILYLCIAKSYVSLAF